jgi:YVTN family beta-propeller protein
MPKAAGWTIWPAERADREGAWEVGGPNGAGERYLQPAASTVGNPAAAGAALIFPFETDRPATLRVRPVWWPTGEQKLAKRFPYPLVRQPGPDALDYVGATLFASAPAAGRVIAIDAATEKPIGAIEVGGYVADIVADRENGRVYIADALGDRVVAIDANARTVLGAMNVPGTPWSLALHGGVLYVACRDGRRLVGFDTTDGKTVCDVALPAEPISVEVTGNPPAGLVVRFQQQPFDVFTLEPAPADAQQFASTPSNGAPPPGCGGPDCDCSWPEVAGPHQLADVGFKKAREVLDVSKVTRGTAPLDIVSRFGDHPGPAAAVQYGFGEPKVYYTWFLSPSLGRLGVLAYKARALDSFELGGYLSGMALVNDKLYITDAAGDRVIVFDPKTRKVESEISVPGQPWSLAVVGNVNPQRSDPWPPKLVNRLYVICRESTDLAAVDLASKQVANRVPLTAEARGVKFVAMPNPDWWPVMADERIPLVLQPRVAVEYRPVVLDLATLQPKPAPMETAEAAPTRKAASSASKSFSATNELVVGVDGKRWVDISALADPQLLPDRPLATKDTAGSITVSVDGGPEMNWAAATWMAPDSEMFLVNEGEEFWRYNAPALEVRPGRHALRVRANSPFARLEAVAVRRSPEPQLDATLLPEPQEVHAKVPLISYQGVFYDQEPARFTLRVTNGGAALTARLSWTLHNYMGEVVQTSTGALMLAAGETLDHVIAPTTKDTGRFTLTAVIDTPDGQVTRQARFLKLPKLEHPRMFWRKEEAAAIQARIAQHPNLFRRYADWLERMSQKEGRLPERFLPAGMTAKELEAVAPEGMPDWDKHEACAWRMYELGWRMLAAEFATIFLKPDSEKLRTKVEALRNAEKTDGYVQYHHHGPFFPGAAASLVDLAPDGQRANLKLYQQMAAAAGDVNTLPWTLVTLEDPLTPEKRALIYKIMTLENNAEQYFETHRGTRGGLWWSDPYTGCYCPIAGYMLTFMYLHNIFGEPRMFEKPLFSGYLTFQRYADPYRDIQELQPGRRGPNGEPWRWILSTLSRHPLEKSNYQWEEWIAKMDGPMAGDEQAQVDRLMALDKMALTGPLRGGVNYFTSGVAVPVALALGWYEPEAPQVTWQEIPTTAVFDMEGWAMMRSGWEAKATEVTFASGVRDHTTRHKPNHFTVIKAGSYLIGTPALLWDDGNMVAAWANSVVVNDAWPEQWALNLTQPRDGEHLVINRFSPATFTYIGRNQKMFGYKPAEQGWGGGLDLHGHTHTLFMREGRLLAYQTWPQLDYVAGDASNAWPADQVSQIDRQLVFLKPDFIVIYDRVKLGPAGRKTAWVATTAPTLTASGDTFVVKGGSEYLTGRVLLPKRAVIATPQPMDLGWVWKDQKLLQIAPAEQSDQVEYLVVMRAGGGDAPLPAMQLIQDDRAAGVRLSLGGRAIELRFDRTGPVGGEAAVSENGKSDRYQLREAIVDSYANWASDPRFRKWTTESRFGFVIPQGDRR